MKEIKIHDMPKLESPFEREETDKGYVCIPKFREEYKWIFDEKVCNASEKFDGTNVSILIEDGVIKNCWNRTERLPFFNKGKKHIIEGLLNSYERGYMEFLEDEQHFGELLGPKVNSNPSKLEQHLWLPFKRVREKYEYKFWHNFVKDELDLKEDFDNCPKILNKIEELFKGLRSRWFITRGSKEGELAEGIVFFNKETGQMCKLRRDMFSNFEGKSHHRRVLK
ncbi:MAG: RNA ligase family protein [Nanoarchaeota archaeon]|nr:RNA ligase family protein [Nanoarchaeota archaeon]